MRTRTILIGLLVLALPIVAEAAGAPRTFKELAGTIFSILSYGITMLVTAGIVLYLWGIASNMTKLSQGEVARAYRAYVLWGIIIIFVMVSIFGIVRLVTDTFFTSGNNQVPQQQPQPSSLLNP
jgi:hypothetical protein